jgi:hypothetical protein
MNPVERKLPVGCSATLLAENKCREAVRAPPLKWSRHAALARCCTSRNTLIIEEAMQVGVYPRNKFLDVGVLGLRDL